MSRPSRTCAFGVSSKAACYSLSACNLKSFWQPCYPKAHAPETTIAQHAKDVVSDSPGFCYGASGFCLNLPDGETVINPACWNFLWASAHKLHLAKRKSCAVAFFAPCSSWSRSKSLVLLVASPCSRTTLSCNLCRGKKSFKPRQNECDSVEEAGEKG